MNYPWPEKPGWLKVDCGCCNGLQWGGTVARECKTCQGSGFIAEHYETGTLALYPGGPFCGSIPTTVMRESRRMSAKNNRQRGKDTERAIAKRFNGRRIGTLGKEDVEHPLFSIEVKGRKSFVGCKFMSQAKRNCPEGKTPLVVVHVTNQNHDEDFVLMRLRDFEDFLGKL